MRGQANLPALAVALLVVTITAGLAFSFADGAFTQASRDSEDRQLASALAERLVAGDSPLTERSGVIDASDVANLTYESLHVSFPAVQDVSIRLRLGDETVVERGDPVGGATIRRVVLVVNEQKVTLHPPLRRDRMTLPRRTAAATLAIDPPEESRVRTVRANGRVVLHDPAGLDGRYRVDVSRFETTTLAFEADGSLEQGDVTITYTPERTTKSTLEVTVDA